MAAQSLRFLPIEVGARVRKGDGLFEVTKIISCNRILVVNLQTKNLESLRIEEVNRIEEGSLTKSEAGSVSGGDLLGYSSAQWSEAQRRFAAIKPLLENPNLNLAEIDAIAKAYSVHRATIYRWLRIYNDEGQVSALVPVARGAKAGRTFLREDQEKVISSVIQDLYLRSQRNTQGDVVVEVQNRCRRAGIRAPNHKTVRRRIAALNPARVLRKRGRHDLARNSYEPIQQNFPGATHPLAIVQIDHTQIDIIVVDEVQRLPVSRPWLTLAIDVYSRMVVGIHLGFDEPSAVTAGMCLAHAICTKNEYLAQIGVTGEWPTWGLMSAIHSDNGSEFHSGVLQRACENFSIDIHWRAIPKPHWGGHIERLMGTVANEIRKLPGTTFSNPSQRRGYNSEGRAALTIRELERHLVEFIVNVYHRKPHSQLGIPPITRWEDGILGDGAIKGTGVFAKPADPRRIRIEFLPDDKRQVLPYGIRCESIFYYNPILDSYINMTDPDEPSKKRKFTIRRDPRDISKIYFLDPTDNQYYTITYRDTSLPAVSLREFKAAKKFVRDIGESATDLTAIFAAIERNRDLVDTAQRKTKAARRALARRPQEEAVSSDALSKGMASLGDDPFSKPIIPFDIISLTR